MRDGVDGTAFFGFEGGGFEVGGYFVEFHLRDIIRNFKNFRADFFA
jgi:hypothetical protein